MADRYTKIVLTIIATALVALAIEHGTPEAKAQTLQFQCGSYGSPCYVAADKLHPLAVEVQQ